MENIGQYPDKVRKAAYGGMFYPGDPVELAGQIDSFISAESDTRVAGEILGLVSPHAGYMYSGSCAAAGFSTVRGIKYDVVVVIAPSHQAFFHNSAVFTGGAYQTPLGKIHVDLELAAEIANVNPKVVFSDEGHLGGAQSEHSLEVQLPFLQQVLGDFKLVPIVMGSQEIDQSVALGEVLSSVLQDKKALIVASSDLSHYHSAEAAKRMDDGVIDAIERYDHKLLFDWVSSGKSQACGTGPIIACMYACKRLGARQSKVLKYTHSGMTTGDDSEVVGYLSAAFFR